MVSLPCHALELFDSKCRDNVLDQTRRASKQWGMHACEPWGKSLALAPWWRLIFQGFRNCELSLLNARYQQVPILPQRWALVLGSEHYGVSAAVRAVCDPPLKAERGAE